MEILYTSNKEKNSLMYYIISEELIRNHEVVGSLDDISGTEILYVDNDN